MKILQAVGVGTAVTLCLGLAINLHAFPRLLHDAAPAHTPLHAWHTAMDHTGASEFRQLRLGRSTGPAPVCINTTA